MCEERDCFNCPYPDCIVDGINRAESDDMVERDRYCHIHSPKYEGRRKYEQTQKGKDRQQRYNSTEKGKERWRRYYQRKKLRLQQGVI